MKHPEQLPGEIYLGNIVPSNLVGSAWKTKRLGNQPFKADGTPYEGGNLKPWFIQRSEVQEAINKERQDNTMSSPGRIEVYERMLNYEQIHICQESVSTIPD